MEEARREAVEASHAYAAEIKRQVAEAMKAGQAQDIDMDKIKREVAQATAIVDTPEFKAQMVELQAHMQQLHDNMAELREHMKELNREIEKSVNAPM
jgi:PHD/YefM family antitoxin component YafN of YafNO toxin-antitoxin module